MIKFLYKKKRTKPYSKANSINQLNKELKTKVALRHIKQYPTDLQHHDARTFPYTENVDHKEGVQKLEKER